MPLNGVIDTLPVLIREIAKPFDAVARRALSLQGYGSGSGLAQVARRDGLCRGEPLARPQNLAPTFTMHNPRHSLPNRRSVRLQGHDYRSSGAYFVTICTVEKQPLFGMICDGSVQLNELGQIADNCWKQIERIRSGIAIDAYIVMPNHIHGILHFSMEDVTENTPTAVRDLASGSLGAIVGQYKSIVTKQCRFLPRPPPHPIWQRNYYDHIIRSAASLEKIRQYIFDNPARWEEDDLHIG